MPSELGPPHEPTSNRQARAQTQGLDRSEWGVPCAGLPQGLDSQRHLPHRAREEEGGEQGENGGGVGEKEEKDAIYQHAARN